MIFDHKTTFDNFFYFFSISFFRNQLVLPSTGQVLQAGAVKYSLHTITVALTVQGGTAGGGRGRGLNWVDVTHWDLVDLKSKNWTRQTSFSNDQGSIKNSLIINERQKQKQKQQTHNCSVWERECVFLFCFLPGGRCPLQLELWWSSEEPQTQTLFQTLFQSISSSVCFCFVTDATLMWTDNRPR